MQKILKFIAVTLTVFLISPPLVKSQKLTPVKLQLKWYHQFQFAGYYAAQIKGYYKDEGLEITILEGSKDISPIEVISKNNADFGIFDPEILIKNPKNNPLMAVFATMQSSPYGILSKRESNIRRPGDLVGKKILAAQDQGWNIFKAIMLKEGIPVNKTNIIPRTKVFADAIDKSDAVITYLTSQPQRVKMMGVDAVIMKPLDYEIDFYGDVVFTTQKFAQSNPETVEAFNKATRKGWEYALKHKEEMIDYILQMPGIQKGLTAPILRFEADELKKLIAPNFVEIGHMNPGKWQNMLSIYQELGLAPKNISLKNFLFETKNEKTHIWYRYLLYGICIVAFVILLVLIWNWQLRKLVDSKTAELSKENLERKKAEQRLELAIEAAGIGVWDWDINPVKSLDNFNWIKKLGYAAEEINEKTFSWENLIHPNDIAKVNEARNELFSGVTHSNNSTYRLLNKSGDYKWVISFRKVLDTTPDGKATHITEIHLEIDELKRKEVELQELTKELMKVNSELEKFAFITSHNLRAPIVNLKSLAELYTSGDFDIDIKNEIFEKIQQSITRLEQTLDDLVEIVSMKYGQKEVKEELDLQLELDQALLSVETQVSEAKAIISTNFDEVKDVHFSRKYLQSIFLNLITNAIKYKSPDRQLKITVTSKKINQFIIVKFSDNGTGMDLERFKNKIFGLYQRFHSNIEGKGLGLYIIRSQIEGMDGKIDVERSPEGGLTFKIYFHDTGNIV